MIEIGPLYAQARRLRSTHPELLAAVEKHDCADPWVAQKEELESVKTLAGNLVTATDEQIKTDTATIAAKKAERNAQDDLANVGFFEISNLPEDERTEEHRKDPNSKLVRYMNALSDTHKKVKELDREIEKMELGVLVLRERVDWLNQVIEIATGLVGQVEKEIEAEIAAGPVRQTEAEIANTLPKEPAVGAANRPSVVKELINRFCSVCCSRRSLDGHE